ncbi:hypothetical protein [Thalassomonas sp. RHCl1]|uniref:hypothetical protein n=1 Tax=Thalassomonas sp. RHCl1 TaxID=2995320 RepID=UPI00248C775F|nr:hypothetical protein [Thalassomonas sp. RHCl1]
MSLYLTMFDDGDEVEYGLTFSKSDAEKILEVELEDVIELTSIGGSVRLTDNNILVVHYKNGSRGHGSIYTDYFKVCDQINEQL